MMSSVRVIQFLIALFFSCAPLNAAGWTSSVQIISFIPTDTQLTLIVTGNDNALGCSVATYFHLHTSDSDYALISSSLLTAFAQGKSVKVWASTCDSDGPTHITAAWIDR